MRLAFCTVSLIAIVFSVGAQKVPPNAAPPATTKSAGAVGKLNGQEKTRKTEQKDSNAAPELTCVQCLNPCPVNQPQGKNKEEQAKADSLDLLYRRYMWATIIGVCGGLVGVAILVWQTVITRRSANAAKMSAVAAKASADALINSERAWVFADIGQLPADFAPTPDAVGIVSMPISFRNYGRTPGRIVRLCLRPYQMQTVGVLPSEPEYRDIRTVDFILPPNVSVPQGIAIVPVNVDVAISDFVAIRGGTSLLYVYGFIDYIAFGSIEQQTRFCWRYHVPHGFNRTPEGFHGFADIPRTYTKCT